MTADETQARMLAPRMGRFSESPTTAMSGRARDLIRQGRDVIKLSSGEPDVPTPEPIRAAAKDAIDAGKTGSTNVDGLPELKEAIVDKFQRENGLTYASDEISVGTVAKQVIANALLATVGEGDEVIIPAPYWVSYPDMVKLAGGTPVFVPCHAESGYTLSAEDLEAAITPATKWLILNNPNNPSGAVWDVETMGRIADVLMRHPHVHVISDDIYEHLTYDNAVVKTIAAVNPDLKPRALTVNGVSKAYAMSGWRIGYCGGPSWLIKAMAKIQSQVTSNPVTVSQRAAIAALHSSPDEIDAYRTRFKSRRDMMMSVVTAAPHLKARIPRGAFYVFADCHATFGLRTASGRTIENDTDLSLYLLDDHGLAVVPGSAFGMGGHLRFSYSVDDADIERAGPRLKAAMAALA